MMCRIAPPSKNKCEDRVEGDVSPRRSAPRGMTVLRAGTRICTRGRVLFRVMKCNVAVSSCHQIDRNFQYAHQSISCFSSVPQIGAPSGLLIPTPTPTAMPMTRTTMRTFAMTRFRLPSFAMQLQERFILAAFAFRFHWSCPGQTVHSVRG